MQPKTTSARDAFKELAQWTGARGWPEKTIAAYGISDSEFFFRSHLSTTMDALQTMDYFARDMKEANGGVLVFDARRSPRVQSFSLRWSYHPEICYWRVRKISTTIHRTRCLQLQISPARLFLNFAVSNSGIEDIEPFFSGARPQDAEFFETAVEPYGGRNHGEIAFDKLQMMHFFKLR